jgi:hypothetical protein
MLRLQSHECCISTLLTVINWRRLPAKGLGTPTAGDLNPTVTGDVREIEISILTSGNDCRYRKTC